MLDLYLTLKIIGTFAFGGIVVLITILSIIGRSAKFQRWYYSRKRKKK